MQQEKEQNLQEARENARIDPETDEACMFITLSNIAALSMEQEYQTAEDFFESFGEDYRRMIRLHCGSCATRCRKK